MTAQDPTPQDKLQLPYMKLLLKLHKLGKPTSHNNLTKLTGRLIITAHSWITSNPSCLQGTKLDRIILQLKNLFKERNIPYPLIYNSYDLLLMLDKLHITNMCDLCLTTFAFTSLYTNISYHDTTRATIMSCKLQLLNLPNFYRDYLLNLNKNETLLLLVIPTISYQGVAMDSYHSRQIVGRIFSF